MSKDFKVDFSLWNARQCLDAYMVYSSLTDMEDLIQTTDNILIEHGMRDTGYVSQMGDIKTLNDSALCFNPYVGSLETEINSVIDDPLYKGFQNKATEDLSRIKLEDYSTDNKIGVQEKIMGNTHGNKYTNYEEKDQLGFADFLGLTELPPENKYAYRSVQTVVPDEFKNFTDLFKTDYENVKEGLKEQNGGKEISLEDYLSQLEEYGEFDNKMDKPLASFVSTILDVTIIKPIIEAATGYEWITGEDLSDTERGMKAAFAVVDAVTLMIGIKASGVASYFSKEAVESAGKIMVVNGAASAVSYGVGKLGETLDLPLPVTVLLSSGAGIVVGRVGSKYVFTDVSTGEVVMEVDKNKLDAALDAVEIAKEVTHAGSEVEQEKENNQPVNPNIMKDTESVDQNTRTEKELIFTDDGQLVEDPETQK